jgi:hypothetical protein
MNKFKENYEPNKYAKIIYTGRLERCVTVLWQCSSLYFSGSVQYGWALVGLYS